MISDTIKHWYLFLILGILFILMGIWAIFTPLSSFLALTIFFAVTFLVSGIFETIYAISNRENIDNWSWNLTGGIIDLLIGILLVSRPEISVIALIFFVGFALMFRSIMIIGWAIQYKKLGIKNWGWLLFSGILSVILSFLLLRNPDIASLVIVYYVGFALVFIGISQVTISLRLKKWKKYI